MNRAEQGRGTSGRAARPQQFVIPDRLPGEDEYGVFMTHLTGCSDCGYGQIYCAKATELWRAYRAARKPVKKRI